MPSCKDQKAHDSVSTPAEDMVRRSGAFSHVYLFSVRANPVVVFATGKGNAFPTYGMDPGRCTKYSEHCTVAVSGMEGEFMQVHTVYCVVEN